MGSRAGTPASIGVDIGGTKVLAALVDADGRVVDTATRATPGEGAGLARATVREVEDALVGVVSSLTKAHGPCTVGVAAAGFVDAEGERVRFAPHLPWRDEPLSARLTERLGDQVEGDVFVDNDANCALAAEARFGAAGDAEHVVMITLGTGIGGALLLGGALHRGRNGMAGELGHMTVVRGGRGCECGGHGCWEQYCSGRALARAAASYGTDLVGPALTDAARGGDPGALRAFADVGGWLGVGTANVVAAIDPDLVVIGGGVSAAGDLLLDPAREALAAELVGVTHREQPGLVAATLGPLAGVVGAAELAREVF